MNLLKYTYCCTILIFCSFSISAQEDKAINVGDKLPNLDHILKPIGLSMEALKGKMVVFDFWNVTCTSCIAAFPKMDKLQTKYQDELVIILVTRDPHNLVKKVFDRMDEDIELPSIVSDTVLIKYFPVKFPHHAWIDKQGRVVGIVNSYNFTEEKIKNVLSDMPIMLPTVKFIENFNTKGNLIQIALPKNDELPKQYSLYTNYISGIAFSGGILRDERTKRIIKRSIYNISVLELFRLVYGDFKDKGNKYGKRGELSKLILNVKDSTKYIPPREVDQIDSWNFKNTYCYEILLPINEAHKMTELIKEDIQRFFNIKADTIKRETNGWAIKKGLTLTLKVSSTPMEAIFYNSESKLIEFRNVTLARLAEYLSGNLNGKIVIDRSSDTKTYDFDIERNLLTNWKALVIYLTGKGLALEPETLTEEVLVLTTP